jgi:DNA invertase Pin-like site-specific DNA recombinase
MRLGYARVSTKDQDTALQEDALRKAGVEHIFSEKASGAKAGRPELAKALEFMREGDTLVVWKLDRLARSMRQLMETVEELRRRKINFHSITENIDTSTAAGELHFHLFGALAQFERSLIKERVNAGLAAARARGRVGGRPQVESARLEHAETLIRGGESVSKAAKLAGISIATLKRYRNGSKTRANGFDTIAGFEPGFERKKLGKKATGGRESAARTHVICL